MIFEWYQLIFQVSLQGQASLLLLVLCKFGCPEIASQGLFNHFVFPACLLHETECLQKIAKRMKIGQRTKQRLDNNNFINSITKGCNLCQK